MVCVYTWTHIQSYVLFEETNFYASLHDVAAAQKVEVEIKEEPTVDESNINVSE